MTTNLQLEALNLVNEEIYGPEVTDEEKYRKILEMKKNRRAVSHTLSIHSIFNKVQVLSEPFIIK